MAKGDKLPIIMQSQVGKPDGVASLDAEAVLEVSQRPELLIVGGSEPKSGPVLWFDTGDSTSENMELSLGHKGEIGNIQVTVDDGVYPIKNAALDGLPQDKPYNFDLI